MIDDEVTPLLKDWVQHQIAQQEVVTKRLQEVRQKSLQRRNRNRKNHVYQPNQFVLVHKSRFPNRKLLKVESPWLGPFKILQATPTTVTILASPTLGGVLQVSTEKCKHWNSLIESSESEEDSSEMPQEDEIAVSSSSLPQNSSQFIVDKILKMKFQNGWKYLTAWRGFPLSAATWEPLSTFITPSPNPVGFEINEAFRQFAERNPTLMKVAERVGRRLMRETPEHLSQEAAQVTTDPFDRKSESERSEAEGEP
jgi:hypothetical protein